MTEEGEAVVFLDSDDEKDKSGEDGKGEEDEVNLELVSKKLNLPMERFNSRQRHANASPFVKENGAEVRL